MSSADPSALARRAREGDRGAFSELVELSEQRLRAVIRRLVGHPDTTDELYQDALLQAWHKRASFRAEAQFTTWLRAIGARLALDYLRAQRPWRQRAQIAYANECADSPELAAEVGAAVCTPDFAFDVREHIAYCFGCVGRSLPPEQQAALVLRDVLQLSAGEAAAIVGATESVLKHRLSDARAAMNTRFDDLCSLVNKRGVCYQCAGLRQASPRHAGPDIERLRDLEERLAIVRLADPQRGVSRALHDLFWRRTAECEAQACGSTEPQADCGH